MADRNRRFRIAAVTLPLVLLAMSGLACAATFTVTNTLDTGMGSLRGAINSANAAPTVANTINFTVSGTITLGSSLPAIANTSPGNLTIDGSGQSITIDGANSFQVFSVNAGAMLDLRNLTIAHGNEQSIPEGEAGGGVRNHGTLTVTNCTFSNNIAGLGGGAILNDSTLTVTNSTFSGNSAEAQGGAIENVGTLIVTNCTFSGNSAGLVKGGGIFNGGAASVKGSILAGSGGSENCNGSITDAGYNISDDSTCFINGVNGSLAGVNPLLRPLANNGGPTETFALQTLPTMSPAIGLDMHCTDQEMTPQPVLTDQRFFKRPNSPTKCDSGAYEHDGVAPIALIPNLERVQVVHSPAPSSDMVNMAFTLEDSGNPTAPCDSGNDALNGVGVGLFPGTCANPTGGELILGLAPFVAHTVNQVSYGTFFGSTSTGMVTARIVQISPTPAGACGEWSINIEVSDFDASLFVSNPFALVIEDLDGNAQCFDITNAIVGNQIPTPGHKVRRRVRR